MSWFSSWIPSLPTFDFAVPSNIQSRFFSFVLKKTLGKFLKPGQLDYSQIDSQIGSGYVQVNDLDLSPEAINSHLEGLPLSLKDGRVSSVKARIPWPNPLASTLGFSVKSLHLTFNVQRLPELGHFPDVDLSQSVALAAEDFFQTELTRHEEADLLQSFHEEALQESENISDQAVPGGLSSSMTAGLEGDPAGISIFASLIENLLARFEFDAEDVTITLLHEHNISLTLSLRSIQYQTDRTDGISEPQNNVSRSLTLRGFEVRALNLTLPTQYHPYESESPASSSSELDEAAHFSLSQSVAFFPPRSPSPSNSMSSSMYHSAISLQASTRQDPISASTPPPVEADTTPLPTAPPEVLLSFGSQPLIVRMETAIPTSTNPDDPFVTSEGPQAPPDAVNISLSIHTIASCIQPWHLHGLLELASIFTDTTPQSLGPQQQAAPSPPSPLPSISFSLALRHVVLLAMPGGLSDDYPRIREFFDKPLLPPPLSSEYARLHIDSISVSLLLPSTKYIGSGADQEIDLQVADFSIFLFNRVLPTDVALSPFPILVTDPHLMNQCESHHQHPDAEFVTPLLPRFEIVDWTNDRLPGSGIKLSRWRSARPAGAPTAYSNPAIKVLARRYIKRGKGTSQTSVDVNVSPLHVRADLRLILQGPVVAFTAELVALRSDSPPPASPTSDVTINDGLESRSHAQAGLRYRTPTKQPMGKPSTQALVFQVKLSYLRVSVACPSPPAKGRRSGQLILDLRDVGISNKVVRPKPSARFAPMSPSPFEAQEIDAETVTLRVDFQRLLLACSLSNRSEGISLVSIGPLFDDTAHNLEGETTFSPLRPSLLVIQPERSQALETALTVLSIDIPSIHADISKPELDSLQYWADDVSQFLERTFSSKEDPVSNPWSRDASLVGSHFFTKSRGGSGVLNESSAKSTSEAAIKLTISEAFLRARVQRGKEMGGVLPLDVKASDIDVLLETNPDGKLQTVVTLGISDLGVTNWRADRSKEVFLQLTSKRSLTGTAKSMVKLRFSTVSIPGTAGKETRIKLTLHGFTYTMFPDIGWIDDMTVFAKNPPGTFETVIPSECTRVSVKIVDGSIRAYAPTHPGALLLNAQDLEFATDILGNNSDSCFRVEGTGVSLLAADNIADLEQRENTPLRGAAFWTGSGYVTVVELVEVKTQVIKSLTSHPALNVVLDYVVLRLHMCADTMASIAAFGQDLASSMKPAQEEIPRPPRGPPVMTQRKEGNILTASIDDMAFMKVPEVGPAPDMIYDDLPTNLEYLDASFGAAAGLREIEDEDMDDFDDGEYTTGAVDDDPDTVSRVGGETIKVFDPAGLDVVENHFLTIPPDTSDSRTGLGDTDFSLRIKDGSFTLLLYDGYDWAKTRKTIEEEVKEMRKRLTKIKQLVATGQLQETTLDDTSALLFNSVHIGLERDEEIFGEPAALIAAIDEELRDDFDFASQSSWQPLPSTSGASKPKPKPIRVHGKRLKRAKSPSMEFSLSGLYVEFDKFQPNDPLVSRTFVTVRDLEILDHIKTSTWKKFLTALRSDSRGNVRETGSSMVRIELRSVRPASGDHTEEARLRAKIHPLRLYVDQDAVDFLKKFFSFKDPNAPAPSNPDESQEAYIQLAEIFPIDLKLDYKPRRVDYKALKEGRTIELMNFFHFDGAEMTLRHITMAGVTGWARLFEMLNDLWTPDVKATQLVEVVSGVAPIRSMVNVGSGVADLILLPISQYKKDGRVVRGMQKGATAFVKSTAIEAIKMGARLATGTQVILEQAEGVLGGSFDAPITAEPLSHFPLEDLDLDSLEPLEPISKYAQQPGDLKEGMQSAYHSLQRNLSSAAQTILAVPMEVYERSGNEGPVRAVIRAVPIAILKPMIGASEAVSKTLLGLHNTLDPNVRHENEAKYK